MIKRTVKEIADMAEGTLLDQSFGERLVKGVSTDSRKLEKEQLFIPLAGERFNGHAFAEQAFQAGVSAVLWNRNEPNPPEGRAVIIVDDTLKALQRLAKAYRDELQVKVVGVTGSNGKTTTKDMIHAVLNTEYKVHKTEGNYNNHIGLPLTILAMPEDAEIAVLEMGMSAKGEIDFLTRLARPDIAVITNIGESHLLELGSREGIAEAKLEIVNGLSQEGTLIYVGDEPLLSEKIIHPPYQTKTFGEDPAFDYQLEDVKQTEEGAFFRVRGIETAFFIPVLGKHNVKNALAAIAAADLLHVSRENIAKGLKALKVTGMRLELVKTEAGIAVINDAYNASPTSMKAAVELVEQLDGYGKKLLVLGDMLELGENEKIFHEEIGQSIDPGLIEFVFAYGDLGAYIAKGALQHFPENRVFHFSREDKDSLKQVLKEKADRGDLILVKASRGMKLEDVVKDL
ncbi:UDP-N-acetylmuramoyl-tripeptide--D-alanyl-D-alanine ligase [Bacillus sonorensis]|uniref:UDP-N-acetylmuramoyl-tripeptide--D-alanyl-D- alanine ligase n=1 Tax=Bacillus sonorensis TaxID=119858 RepID=UPI000494EBC4|nr:UDP-N-acetylmuramoyl-tripeptide--D-alanyl-D-alanine ligase [Bacillus sonorensis]MCY8404237.1 UDP-N-acetylmuramoyl-tripeptide--D-alanyl-D-alanine ligase [Bacillus sonorensis]MEC1353614.1 UDP-N-acetylmuramoyl-tripeptide--D-alanyl-D-alanine ligase [Bacillus sonorensis]MEC1425572.1 UDP-N-acetylmuramoyl-tripeptide--D-alanyl-D-alanine ligase [Bacillus sonorensis]MEC1538213.1 UDP-N-acetylmuramoyl-tripeptide--D-alanyl-D-alanine ligase [Bacillus sonorensis]MEC1591802.1 UDP-N-acetylmuramoyl-tripeptid